jgi:hypothetical protein
VKSICMLMVILLAFNDFAFADQTPPTKGAPQARSEASAQVEKVKEQVQKRGVGEKARVRATLVKGSDVKGYISKVDEASFAVTDKASGQTTTVSYADVQKLQGPGLSKGAKIGITAAVVIGVLVVAVVIIIAKTNKALNNARF